MGIFRALCIPEGSTRDADGREAGDDWTVLSLPPGDGYGTVWITSDHLRVSEFAGLVPDQPQALARLIAHCLNAEYARLGAEAWGDLIASFGEPEVTGPPTSWVEDGDGHRWAFTAFLAVRDDVTLPRHLRLSGPWMDGDVRTLRSARRMIGRAMTAPVPAARSGVTVPSGRRTLERWDRPDTGPIWLDSEASRLLDGLDVVTGPRGTDLLAAVGLRGGEPVVLLAACRDPEVSR